MNCVIGPRKALFLSLQSIQALSSSYITPPTYHLAWVLCMLLIHKSSIIINKTPFYYWDFGFSLQLYFRFTFSFTLYENYTFGSLFLWLYMRLRWLTNLFNWAWSVRSFAFSFWSLFHSALSSWVSMYLHGTPMTKLKSILYNYQINSLILPLGLNIYL